MRLLYWSLAFYCLIYTFLLIIDLLEINTLKIGIKQYPQFSLKASSSFSLEILSAIFTSSLVMISHGFSSRMISVLFLYGISVFLKINDFIFCTSRERIRDFSCRLFFWRAKRVPYSLVVLDSEPPNSSELDTIIWMRFSVYLLLKRWSMSFSSWSHATFKPCLS